AFIFARALDLDPSAVCVDHRLGNGEAKAQTAKSAGDGSLALFEGIEDLANLFSPDPDACVGDSDFDFFRRDVTGGNRDAPTCGREFHTVLDEVPEDLLQAGREAAPQRA